LFTSKSKKKDNTFFFSSSDTFFFVFCTVLLLRVCVYARVFLVMSNAVDSRMRWLRLHYTFHPSFHAACETGAYLAFTLVTPFDSSIYITRYQPVDHNRTKQCIVLPYKSTTPATFAWQNVYVWIRLFSFNRINPGASIECTSDAGCAQHNCFTWSQQRLAYTYLPLEFASYAKSRTRFRLRSMLGSTRVGMRGIIQIDWFECATSYGDIATPIPTDTTTIWNPDVDDGIVAEPSYVGRMDTLLSHVAALPWLPLINKDCVFAQSAVLYLSSNRIKGMLSTLNEQKNNELAFITSTVKPFYMLGLRTKNNAIVHLPIGRVPGCIHVWLTGRRNDADNLTSAQIGYLTTLALRWRPGGATVAIKPQDIPLMSTVEQLELLNSVVSLPAQLRLYRLDSIDVCCDRKKRKKLEPFEYEFMLMEKEQTKVKDVDWFEWTYQTRFKVTHNNLFDTDRADEEELITNDALLDDENDTPNHVFSLGDQFNDDHESRDMSSMSNDCESLTSDALIMFRSILGGVSTPSTMSTASTTASILTEYGLALAHIASQYTFLYCTVASYAQYNTSDPASVLHRPSKERHKSPEPPLPGVRTASFKVEDCASHSAVISTFLTQNPDVICHVVGIWMPRRRWREIKQNLHTFNHCMQKKETFPSSSCANAQTLPSGICDPSENFRAVQFAPNSGRAHVATDDPKHYTELFQIFQAHMSYRLFWVRKPASYTYNYAPYNSVVACCDYQTMLDSSKQNIVYGDFVIARAYPRDKRIEYGVPLIELLHNDTNINPIVADPMNSMPRETFDSWEPLFHLVPHSLPLPMKQTMHTTANASVANDVRVVNPVLTALIRVQDYTRHNMVLDKQVAAMNAQLTMYNKTFQTSFRAEFSQAVTVVYDQCSVVELSIYESIV